MLLVFEKLINVLHMKSNYIKNSHLLYLLQISSIIYIFYIVEITHVVQLILCLAYNLTIWCSLFLHLCIIYIFLYIVSVHRIHASYLSICISGPFASISCLFSYRNLTIWCNLSVHPCIISSVWTLYLYILSIH